MTFMVEMSYICQLLSCYVFTQESIAPLICSIATSFHHIDTYILTVNASIRAPPLMMASPRLHYNFHSSNGIATQPENLFFLGRLTIRMEGVWLSKRIWYTTHNQTWPSYNSGFMREGATTSMVKSQKCVYGQIVRCLHHWGDSPHWEGAA